MVTELNRDSVGADITKARTMPADFYRDARFFELAKDRIFAPSWQFIADTDRLSTPGQVFPWTVLDGYLNEPIVFTRDSSGIRCLSNVCTHRGNIVVENECQVQQMRCRYHGRRFALDGGFLSTPGFEGACNFPSQEDNLPQVPFDTWSKFLFASVAPTYQLEELIGDMKARFSWLPLDQFCFDASKSRDYVVKANWALYVENYLEGFHIPYVHPDLASLLDTKNYRTELHKFSNVQIGIAANKADSFDLPPSSPDYGQEIAAYYYWVFPNMMFNFYPWGLSVNVVLPVEPQLSRIRFLTYVFDESRMGSYSVDDIDRTELEDEAIVEQVQRGVSSRFYHRGRYSPRWESGVHHFHRLMQSLIEA